MPVKRLALFPLAAALSLAALTLTEDACAQDKGDFYAGERGLSLKLSAGASYRQLVSIPVGAANISMALGSQARSGGWYGTLTGLFGSTENGLFVRQFSTGASWEAPLGRLHLGASLRVNYIAISRATLNMNMSDFGTGGLLFASFDLIKGKNYAVYALLDGGFDVFTGTDGSVTMSGATLGAGYRSF